LALLERQRITVLERQSKSTLDVCLPYSERKPISQRETVGVSLLVQTVMFCMLTAAIASAQDTADQHGMPNMPGMSHEDPAAGGWHWMSDANGFFGFNHQERKFTDFSAWESQNWVMLEGAHRLGSGTFRFHDMHTLEPFTMHALGSPQVFQTGETFRKAPLIDYQHPHDLFMSLGGDYTRTTGRFTYVLGADVVGAPTLGPPPFMHRLSAYGNPQAPLSHHYLDSTHITPGVVRGAFGTNRWSVGASWFRGEEPDEKRKDLDLGRLDSYALQLSWTRGAWFGQVSGARLHQPEAITPYDADRLTGSLSYANSNRRLSAWMFAFGQKREIHGNFEAYLLEATVRATERSFVYTRLESVDKDILDSGYHPRGTFHRHRHSQVGALTLGYLFDFLRTDGGNFGIGADVTTYAVPENLREPYGSPSSYHVFLHYALRGPGSIKRSASPQTASAEAHSH
jgi:hypothetical protein